MLKKIETILKNKELKVLFENITALSSVQILSYILPLITIPYLTRVLGPDKYGLVAFILSFVIYFQMLVDFGFNLSASREISINRDNKEKVSEIFSSVMLIKFLLLIISFLILSTIVFSFGIFRENWIAYFFAFGLVIGNFLFPIWFFQGVEKMRYIAILNLVTNLIFTISIFVFIRNPSDYIYVPLLNSLGMIISGLLSLRIIFKYFDVDLILPSLDNIKYYSKESWHIFISSIAVNLYVSSNTFILGILTNNTIVGYYSIAEKVSRAVLNLFTPITQATYPHINKVVARSKTEGINLLKKMTRYLGFLSLIISLLIFIFAEQLIFIIAGTKFSESVIVLRILSFLVFVGCLNNILGIQTMITFNYKKSFSYLVIATGILNILLAFILVPFLNDIGSAIAVMAAESFLCIAMLVYTMNKGINILY